MPGGTGQQAAMCTPAAGYALRPISDAQQLARQWNGQRIVSHMGQRLSRRHTASALLAPHALPAAAQFHEPSKSWSGLTDLEAALDLQCRPCRPLPVPALMQCPWQPHPTHAAGCSRGAATNPGSAAHPADPSWRPTPRGRRACGALALVPDSRPPAWPAACPAGQAGSWRPPPAGALSSLPAAGAQG